mmetsp:Transcript_30867/g.88153  ORF Transcript_30867/g.88153 Transcript_30867/m.88153 type:complete len:354 (+) Transcript_30867:2505-3566(+)
MNPNDVVLVHVGQQLPGEVRVAGLVVSPGVHIERLRDGRLEIGHGVVEQGPQELLVELGPPLHLALWREDWYAVVLRKLLLKRSLAFERLRRYSGPADAHYFHVPLPPQLVQQRAHREVPAVLWALFVHHPAAVGELHDGHWQPVGQQEDGVVALHGHGAIGQLLDGAHLRELLRLQAGLVHLYALVPAVRDRLLRLPPGLGAGVVVWRVLGVPVLPVEAVVVLYGHLGARGEERPVAGALLPARRGPVQGDHDVLVLYRRARLHSDRLGRYPTREMGLAGPQGRSQRGVPAAQGCHVANHPDLFAEADLFPHRVERHLRLQDLAPGRELLRGLAAEGGPVAPRDSPWEACSR